MRRNRSKSIFTLFLLLYFAGFAVSPISAIFPADQHVKDESRDFLKKRSTQADLFFFDLALWEILKKSKQSDNSIDFLSVQEEVATAKNLDYKICDGTTEHLEALRRFVELTQYPDVSPSSPYATTRSTHSGLSPPFFS